MWLLLEGSYYRGWLLFKEVEDGYYSRMTTIRERLLFEGDYNSREATDQGWLLFDKQQILD